MRKMNLCIVSALVIGVMALGTGCASKDAPATADPNAPTRAAVTGASSQMETADGVSEDPSDSVAGENEMQEDQQFTGTFEESKGLMFIVKSDKDGEDYSFDVSDEALIQGLEEGDHVSITYRGEEPSSDNTTDTMVLEVIKTK